MHHKEQKPTLGVSKDNTTVLWGYEEGSWTMYDPLSADFSDLTILKPGLEYRIKADAVCPWTLP